MNDNATCHVTDCHVIALCNILHTVWSSDNQNYVGGGSLYYSSSLSAVNVASWSLSLLKLY